MSLLCVEPGGTRFVRAFAKAFQILKNTIKSSSEAIKKRPSMFLLITDGVTRSKSIEKNSLKAIKKEYKDFKQEVQLITSFKVLTLLLGGKVQKEGSFLKVLMNEMVRAQKYHKKKVKQEFNLKFLPQPPTLTLLTPRNDKKRIFLIHFRAEGYREERNNSIVRYFLIQL